MAPKITIDSLKKNTEFLNLSDEAKVEVLNSVDPNFNALSDSVKSEVAGNLFAQEPDGGFGAFMAETAINVPKSALGFVEDLITPFIHPFDTAKAIGSLGQGIAEKIFVPGTQDSEVAVDNLIQFFKDRYGSIDNLAKTVKTDPVGIAGDIASVLVAGGGIVKGVGGLSKVEKLSKIGRAAGKLGAAVDPFTVGTKTAAKIGKQFIPKSLPGKLFESAVKFPPSKFNAAQRAAMTRTALDNKIMPNIKGLDKIRGKINGLNAEITARIDAAVETGQKIPVKNLFKGFNELKEEFRLSGRPLKAKREILNVQKEINLANTKLVPVGRVRKVASGLVDSKGNPVMIDKTVKGSRRVTRPLSPADAQKLKQKIYKQNESLYNKTTESPASAQAQLAVAKAAKESIEVFFPEIKQLNKAEGAFIELKKALEQPANRISNRDLLGIGIPIKGTTGGMIAGGPGAAGAIALGLFDTPAFKAKLGIVLNELIKEGVQISPTSGFVSLGLFQAGRQGGENAQ